MEDLNIPPVRKVQSWASAGVSLITGCWGSGQTRVKTDETRAGVNEFPAQLAGTSAADREPTKRGKRPQGSRPTQGTHDAPPCTEQPCRRDCQHGCLPEVAEGEPERDG
jgi:hypothetical protein